MAVPTLRRISAPAPEAKYGGSMWIKHIVVITIGRSRTRAASTAASNTLAPSSLRSRGEHAVQLAVAGELDDQDGVLARQAHEHHKADLCEEVNVQATEGDAGKGTQDAHRH